MLNTILILYFYEILCHTIKISIFKKNFIKFLILFKLKSFKIIYCIFILFYYLSNDTYI